VIAMPGTGDDRFRIVLAVAALVAALDQLTKWIVVGALADHETVVVIDGFFNLVHIRNRGAAFGFLNSPRIEWQFWLFVGAACVAVWAIGRLARSARYHRPFFAALGGILGGAAGNLADRLRLRAVVDFLDVHVGDWHWPAFNLADCAICVGALLVCLNLWRTEQAGTSREKNVY
jgi:signal peptidase II